MKVKASASLDGIKYEWLGQSTVRITGKDGLVVYTDPVELDDDPPKGDLILITHHHVDHCLPEFVAAIRDESTRLVAFHDSYIKYCTQDIKGVRTVKIGQTIELGGVRITGVEAYTKKGFHMRGEGCGFTIELSGQRIYLSGDTARTEEMDNLKDIDVAVISLCDNIHAIEPDEIVEAVKKIRPRLFIPVHFTPLDESNPQLPEDGLLYTKDPRFFTKKEDPARLVRSFEGSGIEIAVLKKLGRPEI